MPEPRFAPQVQDQFADDLKRAAGYKPFTQEDLRKGIRQYDKKGVKFVRTHQHASDTRLYNRAVKRVIAWWKRSQEEPSGHSKVRDPKGGDSPRTPRPSAGGGGGYGYGGSSGGRSGGGGSSMPDTSIGGRGYTGPKLPDIDDRARDSASNAGDLKREQIERAQRRARAILRPSQVTDILRNMNVPNPQQWNPPPHAIQNKAALKNWVIRYSKKHNILIGRERTQYQHQLDAQRAAAAADRAAAAARARRKHNRKTGAPTTATGRVGGLLR